jgi:multiple antibiotic resistance protein
VSEIIWAAQAFATLFLIVDPIGLVPVFMGLIGEFAQKERKKIISKAVLIAAASLMVLTIFGDLIFTALGISMYSFKIAGGILLLIISLEMLFGSKTKTGMSENMEADKEMDLAVSPLAVPLLTGPGAISSGIMLFNTHSEFASKIITLLMIPFVFAIAYVILTNGDKVYGRLGKMGTKVTIRLMGLMLSAISIQYIISGFKEAFPTLLM